MNQKRAGRARTASLFVPLFAVVGLLAYLLMEGFIMEGGVNQPHFLTLAAYHRRACHSPSIATQLGALPQTSIITDAAKVADRIKVEAQAHYKVPTAVLFLSNAKYEARFEEMIKTWSQFAGKNSLVMASLDNATDIYFQDRGIKTVRMLPQDMQPESSVREAVLQTKAIIPYVFLLKGLRVVMVEMDIFCRSNPLRFDNGTADVLVAEHDYCEEINVGFWIAYPSCPVIDSFRRMNAWITYPDRADAYCDGAFDQKLMHYAWLGRGALSAGSHSRCRDFIQRDQLFDPRAHKPVTLERASFQHIMHWAPPWVQRPDPETWPSNSSNPACVHIWSGFGPPHEQIRYGYRRGWYPSESEGEAIVALEQLDAVEKNQ